MARLRKNAAYQNLERPYTRISKYTTKNYVRGGFPHMKVIKFEMGNPKKEFETVVKLNSCRNMNVRHNALESARMTANRLLEKTLGKEYHLKIRIYPFHVLRENPLASGAGADRLSSGMKHSFGVTVGRAALIRPGKELFFISCPTEKTAREARKAIIKAKPKVPCKTKIVFEKLN